MPGRKAAKRRASDDAPASNGEAEASSAAAKNPAKRARSAPAEATGRGGDVGDTSVAPGGASTSRSSGRSTAGQRGVLERQLQHAAGQARGASRRPVRPPAGDHRRTGRGERRRHSPRCSGPSSPPSPCRRGSSSTCDHHRASLAHLCYTCAARLPAFQSCAAHLPRPGRPSAAGGARRRLVWRHRRRLAIVLSRCS